jgi:hypothetical protein
MQAVNKNYKENVVHNSNNTLGVVVIGKDQKSIINTGHSLFYVKDRCGNKTYYENTTQNFGFSGGARKLTESEYVKFYGNRKFLAKEFELSQTQYNDLVEGASKSQPRYNVHHNNCIQFVNRHLEKSGLDFKTRDIFNRGELESIGIGEWFYNYHEYVPDSQEMPKHDVKNIGRNLKDAFGF